MTDELLYGLALLPAIVFIVGAYLLSRKSKPDKPSDYIKVVSISDPKRAMAQDVKVTARIADRDNSDSAQDKIETAEKSEPRLARAEIQRQLVELVGGTTPHIEKAVAMCYAMAPIPKEALYICPACGTKTIYALETPRERVEPCVALDVIKNVEWYILNCRRLIAKIDGIAVELDESQFCRKYSPDIEIPNLGLNIAYVDGSVHRVWNIADEDVEIIRAFMAGEKTVGAPLDEKPLKDYTNRLEELLGVEVNIPRAEEDE